MKHKFSLNRFRMLSVFVILALVFGFANVSPALAQPVSAQSTIQINATAVSVPQITLTGVATFPTNTVQSFDLLPGNYQLQYGTVVGFGTANFSVTASGTVDYDPSLDLILNGRGTNSLVVLGATIQFDARALSVASLTLGGITNFPTQTTFSATLLPGVHRLAYGTVVASAAANFTVTASGTVDYDPSLDLILSGRGTNSLVVLGATIQFDARALSAASLSLGGITNFPTQATFSATLLPGVHRLAYATVVASAAANFTVTASGAVDYDPSLDLILSGRGTNSLTILGATVQIDARALSAASLLLGGISDFPTQTIFSATLLPGVHMLQYGTVVGKAIANFTVTASGAVDYDPSLDLILSGRNTSTLTLVGVPIRINAATLSGSSFDIPGVGTLAVCPVPIVTLLPATYRFVTTDAQFNFMVTNGAVVDYDAALDSFVSGRGTNTLTIHGSGIDCNIAPVAEAGGPYNVNEGGSVTVTASGTDPENGPLTYAWDLDNNGTFEIPGQSATFSAANLDGPSTHTIAVQVTDEGGLTATDQATVDVLNIAPTADFTSTPSTLFVGQSATLAFSNPFDPGSADTTAGFHYSYDCTNDGSFELSDTAALSYACAYPASGAFTARGRIQDRDGDFTDYTVQVTVLTPREGAAGLIDQVHSLVAQGELSDGQGNALIAKLDGVIKQLEKGKTKSAVNELRAFISQVNDLMSLTPPILTPAEGQPLIDAANAIIAALGG